MTEGVTADADAGKTKYEAKLPVRCDDCGEVSTKTPTIILAENLPECPNCGASHMGGCVPEDRLENTDNVVDEMVEFAEAAFNAGATTTQVFDYLFAIKLGQGIEEWAEVRDVGESAVQRRVDHIRDLQE
jgi:hypothetical protein